MTSATTTERNGIDTARLVATVEALERDPSLARFTFRAASAWKGGARSRTEIQGFYGAGREDDSRTRPFVLQGDEPPVLLGSDTAPNAVETVLHALASCLTVGFVYNAAARGIDVRAMELDLDGALDLRPFLGLDQEERPGFQRIDVRYRVDTDAPRDQVEDLCAYVQRTSPVLDVLTKPVPVSVTLEP